MQELFEQLMSLSRKLQYQLLTKRGALGRLPFIGVDKLDWENSRIVFQGTEGAYSQAAMEMYFGKDTNSFHVQTFRDAMEAIEEGSADLRYFRLRTLLRVQSMRCMICLWNLKIIS